MDVLVDTDVLINTLRKKPDRGCIDFLRHIESGDISGYLSVLTVFELYYGAYLSDNPTKNIKPVNELLSIFSILDLSLDTCKHSGQVGAGLCVDGAGIDFRDLLIGVTARQLNMVLVSYNLKHFSRINGLRVKKPDEI